jgi:hypothetical protein
LTPFSAETKKHITKQNYRNDILKAKNEEYNTSNVNFSEIDIVIGIEAANFIYDDEFKDNSSIYKHSTSIKPYYCDYRLNDEIIIGTEREIIDYLQKL